MASSGGARRQGGARHGLATQADARRADLPARPCDHGRHERPRAQRPACHRLRQGQELPPTPGLTPGRVRTQRSDSRMGRSKALPPRGLESHPVRRRSRPERARRHGSSAFATGLWVTDSAQTWVAPAGLDPYAVRRPRARCFPGASRTRISAPRSTTMPRSAAESRRGTKVPDQTTAPTRVRFRITLGRSRSWRDRLDRGLAERPSHAGALTP
jgi:hypothetical protein